MSERKYFIDWIRVIAFFLLILFHCAMPFVMYGWEIKNETQYKGLTSFIWWLHQWRLPLLFFVSGVGINFALKKRSVLNFAGERFVRLFIPLLFAMFLTIPLQVYFEWLREMSQTEMPGYEYVNPLVNILNTLVACGCCHDECYEPATDSRNDPILKT